MPRRSVLLFAGACIAIAAALAAALIAALPTVAVYVLAGRYFVRGLTAGAVKG